MVTAAEFNSLVDDLVAGPVAEIGGWQEGRRVFFQNDLITAAILRTELRYQPPVKLTLCIRHPFLRGLDETVPSKPPANPSDYPIKIAPSQVGLIASTTWRYESHNLGRWPHDLIPYTEWPISQISASLEHIGATLAATLPGLGTSLPPDRMLQRLLADGENDWCEQLWIADLTAAVGSA